MPERQKLLLSNADGRSFGTTDPFQIATELRQLVGEVEEAKPTQTGSFLITTKDTKHVDTLLQLDSFLQRKVPSQQARQAELRGGHRVRDLPA